MKACALMTWLLRTFIKGGALLSTKWTFVRVVCRKESRCMNLSDMQRLF